MTAIGEIRPYLDITANGGGTPFRSSALAIGGGAWPKSVGRARRSYIADFSIGGTIGKKCHAGLTVEGCGTRADAPTRRRGDVDHYAVGGLHFCDHPIAILLQVDADRTVSGRNCAARPV